MQRTIVAPVITFALTLAGCQTGNVPDLQPDQCLLREAEAQVYQPILLSREDLLTEGTLDAILAHNTVYWCRHEDRRPEGFDAELCED